MLYSTLFLADLIMPKTSFYSNVKFTKNFGPVILNNETPQYIKEDLGKEKYTEIQKTSIFQIPVSYSFLQSDQLLKKRASFDIFIHGCMLFTFLLIGGIYGVFVKKELYLDFRAAVYNIIVGTAIMLILFNVHI